MGILTTCPFLRRNVRGKGKANRSMARRPIQREGAAAVGCSRGQRPRSRVSFRKQQACVSSFYESTPGKVTEFGSVLSMAPGWGPNAGKSKGKEKGFWAVTVRANWRVIFRFDGEAQDVDCVDYH